MSNEQADMASHDAEENLSQQEDVRQQGLLLSSAPLPFYLRRIQEPFRFDHREVDRLTTQFQSIRDLTEMITTTAEFILQQQEGDVLTDRVARALEGEIEVISYSRVSSTSVVQF